MSDEKKACKVTKGTVIKLFGVLAILAVLIVVIIAIVETSGEDGTTVEDSVVFPEGGPYPSAAASSDGTPCAAIAMNILKAGGNAADAAIAGSLCSGVVNPQSMGIGGGFLLTFYNRTDGMAYTLNARETAPAASTSDMYQGNSTLSTRGGLAVAIPGEVRGLRALYERFGGGVPWASLFDEAIALCEDGFRAHFSLANALTSHKATILAEETLSMLVDPSTNDVYKENDTIRFPQLGATLRTLQTEPDALYTGTLASQLVEDLANLSGIITAEDMSGYQPVWDEPIRVYLDNGRYTVYSIKPPGSGAVLAFILNVLDGYFFNSTSIEPQNAVLTHQRIVETFKYAYGFRSQLGDAEYTDVTETVHNMTSNDYAAHIRSILLEDATSQDPAYYGAQLIDEDAGTSHFSVVAPNGDAVAMTSTINTSFGAKIASSQTGVIYNNEMSDFAPPDIVSPYGLPPAEANFIEPGKRPLSSMSPTIVVSPNGEVRLVVGAAGGTRITTATALTAIRNLWFGTDLQNATSMPRIHHQLMPMTLRYEQNFDQDVVDGLSAIGHTMEMYNTTLSVISVVSREEDGNVYAAHDYRKHGQTDGF